MCNVIPPDNIEELVNQYITLRDKLKASDDAHKLKTKEGREYLDILNGKLLERLMEVGGEGVKTKAGTVYRSTKKSATLSDGDAFRKWVQENEAFDLVDWRANATAISDFIDEHEVPPPGVNFSTTFIVGVRRK